MRAIFLILFALWGRSHAASIPYGTVLFKCDFDGCSLNEQSGDKFSWKDISGPSPTANTGPVADVSGSGKYLYAKAEGQDPLDNAVTAIEYSKMTAYAGEKCLKFAYHMFGADMGTLNVILQTPTAGGGTMKNIIWTKSGYSVNMWTQQTKDLPVGEYDIQFEAIVGKGQYGDIAIDNIQVLAGRCGQTSSPLCNVDPCNSYGQCTSDIPTDTYTCNCVYGHVGTVCQIYCKPMDICLLIDESGSIGATNWVKQQQFSSDLVSRLDIGSGVTQANLALVTFGDDGKIIWNLGDKTDRTDILASIKGLPYNGGSTNTSGGIYQCLRNVFGTAKDRPSATNVMVTITDGKSNVDTGKTKPYAKEVHVDGVTSFVVTVGSNLDDGEIRELASDKDEDHTFAATSFDSLATITDAIQKRLCAAFDLCSTNNQCVKGICVTTGAATFACKCEPGYSGTLCDKYDYCYQKPCWNGGSCLSDTSSYKCTCPAGFAGPQCRTKDYCASKPCLNGGSCTNNLSGYTCACVAPYSGTKCEIKDYCASKPCQNGGSCTSTATGPKCACPTNYKGTFCETRDDCLSNPCKNGGSCVTKSPSAGFTCTCPKGFIGTLCETVDYCASSPCLNGGTCTNGAMGFTCQCPTDYVGTRCESLVTYPCKPNPCYNGGTCSEDGFGSYVCACPPQWFGKNCQFVSLCETLKPCQNGGTCIMSQNTYVCECPHGFGGQYCEIAYSTPPKTTASTIVSTPPPSTQPPSTPAATIASTPAATTNSGSVFPPAVGTRNCYDCNANAMECVGTVVKDTIPGYLPSRTPCSDYCFIRLEPDGTYTRGCTSFLTANNPTVLATVTGRSTKCFMLEGKETCCTDGEISNKDWCQASGKCTPP